MGDARKPYVVKVPKIVWALNEFDALDVAEKEYGARPKKARESARAMVPRELFDIAQANGWCEDKVCWFEIDGRRWVGDGRCMVLHDVEPRAEWMRVSDKDAARVVSEPFATAKVAPLARKRTHVRLGETILDIRFIRVVEHFYPDAEWRETEPLGPAYAVVDGAPVAAVMPMRGTPDDREREDLEYAISRMERSRDELKDILKQEAEILDAEKKYAEAHKRAQAVNRKVSELHNLAVKAGSLRSAPSALAITEERIAEMKARLAAMEAE